MLYFFEGAIRDVFFCVRGTNLKSVGQTSKQVGLQIEITNVSVSYRLKRFETEGNKWMENTSGLRAEANHGLLRRRN